MLAPSTLPVSSSIRTFEKAAVSACVIDERQPLKSFALAVNSSPLSRASASVCPTLASAGTV